MSEPITKLNASQKNQLSKTILDSLIKDSNLLYPVDKLREEVAKVLDPYFASTTTPEVLEIIKRVNGPKTMIRITPAIALGRGNITNIWVQYQHYFDDDKIHTVSNECFNAVNCLNNKYARDALKAQKIARKLHELFKTINDLETLREFFPNINLELKPVRARNTKPNAQMARQKQAYEELLKEAKCLK